MRAARRTPGPSLAGRRSYREVSSSPEWAPTAPGYGGPFALEPLTGSAIPPDLLAQTADPNWTALLACGVADGDQITTLGFLERRATGPHVRLRRCGLVIGRGLNAADNLARYTTPKGSESEPHQITRKVERRLEGNQGPAARTGGGSREAGGTWK
jgi:hypothetical protein